MPSHPPSPPHPLKTYLVEDSRVIRENLIATLEELVPAEVVGVAEDEATAVQWLTAPHHAAELVIVDIFLKTGSGLGVLRALQDHLQHQRQHQLQHHARVVVLSNFTTPEMRRKCLALGADRVFDKSYDIDALIAYCTQLHAIAPPVADGY